MIQIRSLVIVVVVVLSGCQTHNFTQRGAAVGGLTGAGMGAAIGEIAGDRPLVGAAVGSTLGAFSGAAVGSGLDELDARNEARVQQAAYLESARGTSIQEIIAMSESGLSDEVITRHIHNFGFQGRLDAADLISLRQQGVSDRVIGALQEATAALAEASARPPLPVVVEERYHHVPVPARYWRYPRWLHCPPHLRHPGLHWGVSFSN